MPTVHKFSGSAIVYSDLDTFPGPKKVDASCTLTLADDQVQVGLSEFVTPILEDVDADDEDGGLLDLAIRLDKGAAGHYRKADGAVEVRCRVIFTFSFANIGVPVAYSTVTLTLGTDGAELPTVGHQPGVQVAPDGTVTVAGVGRFQGAVPQLQGKRCGMVLQGKLSPPLPR